MITYVNTALTVTKEEKYTNGVCDAVYVEIEEMNIGIINTYRPPSSDIDSFDDILQKIKEWTSHTRRELVLIGDMNFCTMNGWTESDKDSLRESIIGKNKTQWGK